MTFVSADGVHKLQIKTSTAFATENTEFTENYRDIRRFAFLGVLGDLCGKKNLPHLLVS